jgi:mannose-6-phosphate isomerase-like protein (cupin superfamily)
MPYEAIKFDQKLALFTEHWTPKVIAEMNDYQLKLVKLQGEFVWHAHTHTDEVFIVLSGAFEILFRDGSVALSEGEMFVVPKGVLHKPVADQACHVLLVEPRGVVNTGQAGGAKTAEQDVWI